MNLAFNFNLEDEKRKVLEEVRRSRPGTEALQRLRVVREEMDWAIEGYRNSLTILSDTTYEDRKHFLMELIQMRMMQIMEIKFRRFISILQMKAWSCFITKRALL